MYQNEHTTTWLVATHRKLEAKITLNAQIKKPLSTNAPSINHNQQWKVHKLSPKEMEDYKK